jgi:riboflavin synthase
MFTGIIEHTAHILSLHEWRFTLENNFWTDLKLWQSIAHDGACMTLESFDEDQYSFFVMQESLAKTNLGNKKPWDVLNIERCMRANDRVDGHFVTGHVDTTGQVSLLKRQSDNSLLIWVNFPETFSRNLIQKWSIAINGVSLTVIDVASGYLSVSLIPLTQDWTNLGKVQLHESVNLEFDMLGKYILNTQNDC